MKDELDEKIITQFAALRPKKYSYLIDKMMKKNQKAQKGVS